MKKILKDEKGYIDGEIIGGIITILIILMIIVGMFVAIFGNFCMDFASGSHRIIPTAVDNDMWGNYKVYYRTTEYTKNSEEDYYYIDKSNTELAEEVEECIKNGQTLIVYYDKYVGFKGISAPKESPITRIEIVEE